MRENLSLLYTHPGAKRSTSSIHTELSKGLVCESPGEAGVCIGAPGDGVRGLGEGQPHRNLQGLSAGDTCRRKSRAPHSLLNPSSPLADQNCWGLGHYLP